MESPLSSTIRFETSIPGCIINNNKDNEEIGFADFLTVPLFRIIAGVW